MTMKKTGKKLSIPLKICLGAYDSQDNTWSTPRTRAEHMEQLALRQSICYSLNIHDFRDFLGLSVDRITDESLLETMHETRSRSKRLDQTTLHRNSYWYYGASVETSVAVG
jgi:hypothetical protein